MRKRCFLPFLLMLLFLFIPGMAEDIEFASVPEIVRPGKEERIILVSQASGTADVLVMQDETVVSTIKKNLTIQEGTTRLTYSGLDDEGVILPEGEYVMTVRMNGSAYSCPLLVGMVSPIASILSAESQTIIAEDWTITVECNMRGVLLVEFELGGIWETLVAQSVAAEGEVVASVPLSFMGQALPVGEYAYRVTLKDSGGVRSTSDLGTLTLVGDSEGLLAVAAAQKEKEAEAAEEPAADKTISAPTHLVIPSRATTKEEETSYWTMTLGDLTDEQAIWDIMMQPITVISLKGRTARETYKLRATPDKSTAKENVVGEVTYLSQGVHVIETLDNGWSKVEVYNTSYGPKNTNRRGYGETGALIEGYVETSALTIVQPKTDYGLLIDKFEQKMYIFSEGKLIGTLLVSTGKPTSSQPWNETPAGEFLMISRSGGFPSGNLWCDMGMLINGGCLIHEVPCIINEETGVRNYGYTEPALGQKASHGCIRVQRALNEEGQNMKWLWNNIKVNTKVLIWEDSTRYHEYPSSALSLYYNPTGGKYYHLNQKCSSVSKRYLPLTEFTYAELAQEAYAGLTPCKTCVPPERPETIREKNIANGFEE